MNAQRQALFHSILARLSFGAVPVDGSYWFDPRTPAPKPAPEPLELPDADWSPVGLSLTRGRRP